MFAPGNLALVSITQSYLSPSLTSSHHKYSESEVISFTLLMTENETDCSIIDWCSCPGVGRFRSISQISIRNICVTDADTETDRTPQSTVFTVSQCSVCCHQVSQWSLSRLSIFQGSLDQVHGSQEERRNSSRHSLSSRWSESNLSKYIELV